MFSSPAAGGKSTAAATTPPYRLASITIAECYEEVLSEPNHVAVLWETMGLCVVPAEQRAHDRVGRENDMPAALAMIDMQFPPSDWAGTCILGPLTSDYPSAIAQSVKVLRIGGNQYDESAGLGAFAAVATHLRVLIFWQCSLLSVRGLAGRCEYIRTVDLSGCGLLGSLEGLEHHLYLQEVDVSKTAITSIEPLRSCPALTKVDFSACRKLSSIQGLENHQQLQYVDASYTDIASIEPLLSCPRLTTVKLDYCKRLPADAVRALPAGVKVYRLLCCAPDD